MIKAKAKGFTVRPAGEGIFFVRNSYKGLSVNNKTLMDCSNISLKFKEQTVLVEGVSTDDGLHFVGQVRGFEPAVIEKFDSMSIGDHIEFDEAHVFGASD